MSTLLIIVLFILLLTSLYVIRNLLTKVEKLEDVARDSMEFINKLSEVIRDSDELIRAVDEKGTFRSDDEVGMFFEYLKAIQQNLNNFKIPDINGKKTE